jgi:hypothetical protein
MWPDEKVLVEGDADEGDRVEVCGLHEAGLGGAGARGATGNADGHDDQLVVL